jgi:hypothetical protein
MVTQYIREFVDLYLHFPYTPQLKLTGSFAYIYIYIYILVGRGEEGK